MGQSADCLCIGLFLMGFGEGGLAAGHLGSPHDKPIHMLHLLSPKTKPETKSSECVQVCLCCLLPSVCRCVIIREHV